MAGKIKPGMTIYVPMKVKYVRTALNSRDMVCVEVGGQNIWFDMPKKRVTEVPDECQMKEDS